MRSAFVLACIFLLSGCAYVPPTAVEAPSGVSKEWPAPVKVTTHGCHGVNVVGLLDPAQADALLPTGFHGADASIVLGMSQPVHKVPITALIGACDRWSGDPGGPFHDASISIAVRRPDVPEARLGANLELYRLFTWTDDEDWGQVWRHAGIVPGQADIVVDELAAAGLFSHAVSTSDGHSMSIVGQASVYMAEDDPIFDYGSWTVRTWTLTDHGIGFLWQNFTTDLRAGYADLCLPGVLPGIGHEVPTCQGPASGGVLPAAATRYQSTEVAFSFHLLPGAFP